MLKQVIAVVLALCLCVGLCHSSHAQQAARRSAVVDVVNRCKSAVVNISTETYEKRPAYPFLGGRRDPFFDDFFDRFFSPQRETSIPRRSLGSGVVIDQQGHILTNHHVILEASKIHVLMVSGKGYEADLVGSDPGSDIAVLKIQPGESLQPIPVGSSADIMIGETVIAIGNPFGLSNSVTTGVISAVNRSIHVGEQVYEDFIQTDASINPGNSGGPLLNILGELIGINTAIVSEAQGIGFAIPVNRARRIMDALVVYGEVRPAWFGMEVQDLTTRVAQYLGDPERKGVLVTEVYAGSPAFEAGIKVQDILMKADHAVLSSRDDYFEFLQKTTANDSVVFQVVRKGKADEVTLKGVNLPDALVNDYSLKHLGIKMDERTYASPLQAGLNGLVIGQVQPNSEAARIGLRPGDVLLKLNDRGVPTFKEYQRELSRLWCRKNLTLQVLRGRFLYYVTLSLR